METYLGYPILLWQGIISLISVLVPGLVIAFVTTFYLKRKDETTRVAGVILEKRVEAQHEILSFFENSSQKYEMREPLSQEVGNTLLNFGFSLPYEPRIQYAEIFTSINKYRDFFHSIERLFSKHRLWLDTKTRYQLLLIQSYFSSINASMLIFNRLPLPAEVSLKKEEIDELSEQFLLYLGVILDKEFNQLVIDLDVLMVRSIYKLNLARPKRSFMSHNFMNKEAIKANQFLLNKSLLGKTSENVVNLAIALVEALKDVDLSKEQVADEFEIDYKNI